MADAQPSQRSARAALPSMANDSRPGFMDWQKTEFLRERMNKDRQDELMRSGYLPQPSDRRGQMNDTAILNAHSFPMKKEPTFAGPEADILEYVQLTEQLKLFSDEFMVRTGHRPRYSDFKKSGERGLAEKCKRHRHLKKKLYGERSAAKEVKVASVKGSKEPSRAVSVASARSNYSNYPQRILIETACKKLEDELNQARGANPSMTMWKNINPGYTAQKSFETSRLTAQSGAAKDDWDNHRKKGAVTQFVDASIRLHVNLKCTGHDDGKVTGHT